MPHQEVLDRKVISTDKAPAAIGPYSQAIRVGRLVFTAGQIGIDPKTGELVPGGIEAETRQALKNLEAVLECTTCSLKGIVKTTVYLTDMNEFAQFNKVYAEFFSEEPPARSTVQVAALPKGARVEIEAIAIQPDFILPEEREGEIRPDYA